MIKLIPGKLYSNKTLLYIYPILNSLGNEFVRQWNPVSQSALTYAIQDYLYNDAKGVEHVETALHVVLDRYGKYSHAKQAYLNPKLGEKLVSGFLSYFKTHPAYIDDYIFDSVRNPTKHVVVISLGEKWRETFKQFRSSNYDKMYTKIQLGECHLAPTIGDKRNPIFDVLTRNPEHLELFKRKLEKYFNMKKDTLADTNEFDQYDLPINLEDEILNYRK